MEPLPIVRLEVEYMKQTILHAFTEYQMQLDESVRAAVENFCKPACINAVVANAVDRTMRDMVETEVEKFFKYGAGGDVIKQEIAKKLSAYTPKPKRNKQVRP